MSRPARGPNIRTLHGSGSQTQTIQPRFSPEPASQALEIADLRHQVEEQRARIDILTRSLEALVGNYHSLQEEMAQVRKDQKSNSDRVEEVQGQVKKVSNNNKKLEQRVGELDHKASVAYINSTADDEARQFMYDARTMTDGDDSPMTTEEVRHRMDKVQDNRRNRRPGARRP